jgi:hypothetical protein
MHNYTVEETVFGGWLDEFMLWGTRGEGTVLAVWDFDSANQREIITVAEGTIGFATIEGGGRYLYYSVVTEEMVKVFRVKLY